MKKYLPFIALGAIGLIWFLKRNKSSEPEITTKPQIPTVQKEALKKLATAFKNAKSTTLPKSASPNTRAKVAANKLNPEYNSTQFDETYA